MLAAGKPLSGRAGHEAVFSLWLFFMGLGVIFALGVHKNEAPVDGATEDVNEAKKTKPLTITKSGAP